jgi:TPR repeat protein
MYRKKAVSFSELNRKFEAAREGLESYSFELVNKKVITAKLFEAASMLTALVAVFGSIVYFFGSSDSRMLATIFVGASFTVAFQRYAKRNYESAENIMKSQLNRLGMLDSKNANDENITASKKNINTSPPPNKPNSKDTVKLNKNRTSPPEISKKVELAQPSCFRKNFNQSTNSLRDGFDNNIEILNLKTAANNGDESAQFKLGKMYLEGLKTIKDYSKSFEWFHKAAQNGHTDAQYELSKMFLDGTEHITRNLSKALEYLNLSANGGNIKAQYLLGYLYDKGEDVTHDEAKAFEWFSKAAQQGSSLAQTTLGHKCEQRGYLNDAMEWYKKAADIGDTSAMCCLGRFYENGLLVQKNVRYALRWYKMANSIDPLTGKEEILRLKELNH